MKKLLGIVIITLVVSIYSISCFCSPSEYTLQQIKLYEKTVEADVSGQIYWEPDCVGDNIDVEQFGTAYQYGVSDNSENFSYFYDEDCKVTIQVYKNNGVVCYTVYDGEVPISYEKVN